MFFTATPSDLEALDLYSDLTSLPKRLVHAPEDQGHSSKDRPNISSDSTSIVGSEKGSKKRALGRLKHKLALQRLQQVQSEESHSETPDLKAS